MAKYIVATVDELTPGTRTIIEVKGRTIGVFNVDGEFFALRNRCPHQGGPLCAGKLSGLMLADRPGEYRYSRKDEILRCPWHGWEFDIRTGQSWVEPAKLRVRSYGVSVEAGSEIGESGEDSFSHLVKGPYVVEIFPVSVDREYVVVEIP